MSTKAKNSVDHEVPYVVEFEGLALNILKDNAGSKEKLKELLEEYAGKYAETSTS